jgi:exopolysaccharide biosynthesis polyprenyl glycosylphosphotransferase
MVLPELTDTPSTTAARRVPLGSAARKAILVGGDVAVLVAVVALALWVGGLRSHWDWSGGAFGRDLARWALVLVPLWLVLAWANGLYDLRRAPDRWTAAVLAAKASGQILILWAIVYFIPPPWTLVRHVTIFFALGAAVAIPIWRLLYAGVVSRPAFRRRVLVVGAGRAGRALVAAIQTEAPHLVDIAGFADDDPALGDAVVDGVPVVTDRAQLVETALRLGVDELVLAVTRDAHGDLLAALLDAQEQGIQVTPMPVLFEAITGRVPVEHIGDHWAVALPLNPPAVRGLYPLARRGFDLACALVGLIALVPLLVAAAPLIRRGSPGPVFYRQLRVGRGGRPFMLVKLRTMVVDAEPEGPVWAALDDPRVTRVGRWLRRTRLDELPQALNVLRGEMSVVGPRPERPAFVATLAEAIPFYRARHAVRPGLTGWATIHQGYARSTGDALLKLQYDLYYIKHQSLFLDAYILLRTVAAVLRQGGP